jgi:hypothetical protein
MTKQGKKVSEIPSQSTAEQVVHVCYLRGYRRLRLGGLLFKASYGNK